MDFELMLESLPQLLSGMWLTIQIVALSLAFGFVAALGLALARASSNPVVSGFAFAYAFVFRGTPLLVQIALIYYGIGQFALIRDSFLWEFFREAYWCAILALTMNTAAYGSEIIRGGFAAVPHGQVEAARAAGMSGMLVFRRVIFPIAMRQALPAYGNEIVLMVKASALASTVTLVEITGIADRINSRHFAPFEVFTTAGAIYLMINYLATEIVRLAEWRLTPYLRPPHELGHRLTPLDLVRQRPTLVILSVVFSAGLVWGELQ